MNNKDTFEILTIPDDTSYWLVRADGGKYLDDYIENSFISIAHNQVTIESIHSDDSPKDGLKNPDIHQMYIDSYPHQTKHWQTIASSQCFEFINNMKIGDVVLTPGKSSDYFAIGVITGDPFDADKSKLRTKKENSGPNGIQYKVDQNLKRRNVTWMKTIHRSSLPGELYWILSAHQAIFNISSYAEYIDPLIFPLFQKHKKIHLTVYTTLEDDLTLANWQGIVEMAKDEQSNYLHQVELQADVHCPGTLGFITGQENIQAIINIIHTVASLGGNQVITFGGIVTLISLVIGKEGKKKGILNWWDDYRISHIQKKAKLKRLKQGTKNVPDEVKNIKPQIKDVGTVISHENLKSKEKPENDQEPEK
ncbi:hypothetical protein [Lactiplantibacillus pentosus]|uniref:hypothetical protein n=1 Tax=Lactiplantibacillus pentosus TaxID=1589 RepID=UPI001330410E|nr:hypothetical protein [Lactiplantibacillus pentosus]